MIAKKIAYIFFNTFALVCINNMKLCTTNTMYTVHYLSSLIQLEQNTCEECPKNGLEKKLGEF